MSHSYPPTDPADSEETKLVGEEGAPGYALVHWSFDSPQVAEEVFRHLSAAASLCRQHGQHATAIQPEENQPGEWFTGMTCLMPVPLEEEV